MPGEERPKPPTETTVYYTHYLKLLDLFETRQTWAFNFALAIYVGAFSAIGPLFGTSGSLGESAGTLQVLAFSIVLPVLVLAMCCLYADVSIYCAALNAANAKYHRRHYGEFDDPGELAIEWLQNVRPSNDLPATLRMILFALAPVAGLLMSTNVLVREMDLRGGAKTSLLGGIAGFIVSSVAGYLTINLWRRIERARSDAKDVILRSAITSRGGAATRAGTPPA